VFLSVFLCGCIPEAEESVSGRDTVDVLRSRFGRSFEVHFVRGKDPVVARFSCTGKRLDGELQVVAIGARVQAVGSPSVGTGTDRQSPPWTPNLFGAAKLNTMAEVPIECDAALGEQCEARFNGECGLDDSIIPGTVIELEWKATVATRANLIGSAPGLTVSEVPAG
jgi:hypothetical protein